MRTQVCPAPESVPFSSMLNHRGEAARLVGAERGPVAWPRPDGMSAAEGTPPRAPHQRLPGSWSNASGPSQEHLAGPVVCKLPSRDSHPGGQAQGSAIRRRRAPRDRFPSPGVETGLPGQVQEA